MACRRGRCRSAGSRSRLPARTICPGKARRRGPSSKAPLDRSAPSRPDRPSRWFRACSDRHGRRARGCRRRDDAARRRAGWQARRHSGRLPRPRRRRPPERRRSAPEAGRGQAARARAPFSNRRSARVGSCRRGPGQCRFGGRGPHRWPARPGHAERVAVAHAALKDGMGRGTGQSLASVPISSLRPCSGLPEGGKGGAEGRARQPPQAIDSPRLSRSRRSERPFRAGRRSLFRAHCALLGGRLLKIVSVFDLQPNLSRYGDPPTADRPLRSAGARRQGAGRPGRYRVRPA